ncbi:hypothetical protein PR202_ga15043 [Eleusine coracana subsp. coracana]|uniref:Protein FAR1-RELATED SEQUENCE n=1 Tax=Eleusine coracana subsp. coracana TaxID=191504 RepID=A0AAV5CJ47_ELECO|nr:hypothetical protein PR202_ga15043 [Eleusine coracana subsp. coracana]
MIAHCSCMLMETHGIPCRHVIYVLRSIKLNELPSHYVLKRWTKYCNKEIVYDVDGIFLEEKRTNSMDMEVNRMALDMRKDMEDLFQRAGNSVDTMNIVKSKFQKFVDEIKESFLPINKVELKKPRVLLGVLFLRKQIYCLQMSYTPRGESRGSGDTLIRVGVTRRRRRLRKRKMREFYAYAGHAKNWFYMINVIVPKKAHFPEASISTFVNLYLVVLSISR